MHKVIVNSAPLIVLSGVGRLDLLKKLYREVIIPEAVYREVTAKKDSVCMQMIGESDWIHRTIGVFIKAKKLGHLDAVRPVLDEIKENGFYIGTALEKMVLFFVYCGGNL